MKVTALKWWVSYQGLIYENVGILKMRKGSHPERFKFTKQCEYNVPFINHNPPGTMCTWISCIFPPLHVHILILNRPSVDRPSWMKIPAARPEEPYSKSWQQQEGRRVKYSLTQMLRCLWIRGGQRAHVCLFVCLFVTAEVSVREQKQ